MDTRIAAIDFGTNTARLLVAEPRDDGFEHVRLERQVVRMGGGFTREEGLSGDAQRRGLDCLQRFAGIIGELNVSQVRAVATSAVRDAANGPAFVEQVRCRTGIELRVIDGIHEGELTLAGVLAGLDRREEELLVFDVGGGSTEYTLARGGRARFVRSLPMGVVRLTEGKVTPQAVSEKIGRELDLLQQEMATAHDRPAPGATLVGTAGTATTLAAIAMGMRDYDYRKVNNATISRQQIEAIYARLLPMAPEERLTIPGLEKGREDLIIAGILITLHTMERFGFDTMKVSDYGLLEGLVVAGGVVGF
ncbi:exopolyphosphatase [Geobacter sp. FeAm09]|uniref:Ppx/GppA phosphatase family protein n=1 Tax=Geobacter sp. FeAm09 TaxID=2597769 RepID=UPI0011EF016B|nr:exopolyphosphatase [Geobacter sp. FeAm09]QEM68472.1 exopolyphosphatase [Geobacter sp. FeAm09]